ncbi:MAG TPA: outer membrane protein assembly factor BamD [Terriglobales bacterium]|nr:outer membrane protein assembly factor BamD [Terriglobales bacterium]
MLLKKFAILGVAAAMLLAIGCSNKKIKNPIANVDSKQPDKVLFDNAMDAMQHGKYDVARLTLQTLINTYPDSEFVARAKLAIGDSWYAEGTSAALVQAENEYKDFETFFPNMPEAAEAQLKIANIHFKEMEKPDRDFTHAERAQDEYRYLIATYPDSKLVPEAKAKLLQVQEVLAEREFRIGRFYYMRESYPAAEARLKSLVDTYPLYSDADQALLLLGNSYLKQVDLVRAAPRLNETAKGTMIKNLENQAAEAYSKIITRYPVSPGASEAKKELRALKRPVPRPTPEAIAQNKKEEESRGEVTMLARLIDNLKRGPAATVTEAATVGDPTLIDPKQTSAVDLVREAGNTSMKPKNSPGKDTLNVEPVKEGAPPPNQPVPRSDDSASAATPAQTGISDLTPIQDSNTSAGSNSAAATTIDPPAGAQPAAGAAQEPATAPVDAAATPPAQVNEAAQPASGESTSNANKAAASATTEEAENQETSTSKVKKKRGLHKLVPF